MSKFKVGDIVNIKDDSQFSYQGEDIGDGRIIEINKNSAMGHIVENPETGYHNSYYESDLKLVLTHFHPRANTNRKGKTGGRGNNPESTNSLPF